MKGRENEGWVNVLGSSTFLREFGKAVGESLHQSHLSQGCHITQESGWPLHLCPAQLLAGVARGKPGLSRRVVMDFRAQQLWLQVSYGLHGQRSERCILITSTVFM